MAYKVPASSSPTLTRVTTTPYNASAVDSILLVDTDGGAITVNLPAGAASLSFRVANAGSANNDVSLVPNGAELLRGANATLTIYDGEDYDLVYDTTEGWR